MERERLEPVETVRAAGTGASKDPPRCGGAWGVAEDRRPSADAEPHGWPQTLAQEYLRHILRFDIGPRELEAIQRFFDMAAPLGLIERARPIELYEPSA